MRTVEQIKKRYGIKGYVGHNPKYIDWDLAKTLEENRFIVQECFSSGIIRCKLPDWFLLNRDTWDLISDINNAISNISKLHISKYCFYIKVSKHAN